MNTASGKIRQNKHREMPKQVVHKKTVTEELEESLRQRDFAKAVAILEFHKDLGTTIGTYQVNPWLAYASFHMGDFAKAIEVYKEMVQLDDCEATFWLHLAASYYCSGMYKEAEEAALKGPPSSLQNRIMFHVAHKFNDEGKLMVYHQRLQDTIEDQLSLAAIHYFRNHYQEATDIYKRLLLQTREYQALNVYVALCYYKMDYYDVSLEVLNAYIQAHADSAVAINLKACNHFRLYNGKAAETELKVLVDKQSTAYNVENDIVKHNTVVFRNGENALQVLPPLLETIVPEARLNLVIYHLRNDQIGEAFELIKDLEPVTPQEYILKAVVNSCVGQQLDSRDHIKVAREYFQLVGASASECDTIPGRQCMASCFFLLKQFDDVMIYLKSIKPYFQQDDTFLYLQGIALCATHQYADSEESFLSVKSDKVKAEYSYTAWLVRAHINNKHPKRAWEIYLKMDTSSESFSVLQLIANDCYRVGAFYYAAKAFDVLERLDGSAEYWEGKKGACVGVFQQVIASKEPGDSLFEVIRLLETSTQLPQHERSNVIPQAENIIRVMKNWAKDNNMRRK